MKRRLSVIFYWAMLVALLGLFFTNDFGLVDIHKTAIITAVGVDVEEGEVQVTAEIAFPQPSQSGENIKYSEVQGSGLTIADAMSEIKNKTGFYPQLQFCRLIVIGDSCREHELFRVLGCFYRKNYSNKRQFYPNAERLSLSPEQVLYYSLISNKPRLNQPKEFLHERIFQIDTEH